MFDSSAAGQVLARTPLAEHAPAIVAYAEAQWAQKYHGDRQGWEQAVQVLPDIPVQSVNLDCDAISAGTEYSPSDATAIQLKHCLMALRPWRKGPFDLFGLLIDTEWRSFMKWDRLMPHLSPLNGRAVLDVGCGNGYYLYRMIGAGAKAAVGIDPTQLFIAQFRALSQYLGADKICILPLRCEDLAGRSEPVTGFDTVFSMGIYYHRRNPATHLQELYGFLRPGGELMLETLVIDSSEADALEPTGRYARMRNVWSIPSVGLLMDRLEQQGFVNPRLVDLTPTTTEEQRSTAWMSFESLAECLDPQDPSLTVEGYPAPLRAGIIANRPE